MTRMPSRRSLLMLTAAGALSACTEGDEQPVRRSSSPSTRVSDRPERPVMPLVFAVHPTRTAGELTRELADGLLAGRVSRWRELGGPDDPLRVIRGAHAGGSLTDAEAVAAVQRERNALAVIRADALGPGISALAVDGLDPVSEPRRYPRTVPADRPAPASAISTIWTGDIMLGRRVGAAIAASGDWELPFSRTAHRLAAADLTVGNLECTLSKDGSPTQGGDSFGADPRALAGLRKAGFDILVLANNHLGDYGPRALRRTVQTVRGAGFTPVGAGGDAAQARRPAIVSAGGVRFGILAFNAIGETPPPGRTSPGAVQLRMPPRTGPLNRSDLEAMESAITALREEAEVVVVCPHWGQQYTSAPVPAQRTVARRLVEAGADAVIASHPHWVQGMELHKGKLIAHSLGNFVFDMTFSTRTQQGVALELDFWGTVPMRARLLPLRIGARNVPRFVAGNGAEGKDILGQVWGSSSGPFRYRG